MGQGKVITDNDEIEIILIMNLLLRVKVEAAKVQTFLTKISRSSMPLWISNIIHKEINFITLQYLDSSLEGPPLHRIEEIFINRKDIVPSNISKVDRYKIKETQETP